MDWQQIIGIIAPVLATVITQGLKKLIGKGGFWPIAIVIVLGGLAAWVGIGPIDVSNAGALVDKVVNAGFITGLAALIYSISQQSKKS